MRPCSIFIGWDPREADAYAVARHSMRRHLTLPIPIRGLILDDLIAKGLYTRPMRFLGNRLIDELSIRDGYDGAISTHHANARFLMPFITKSDLALFVDGDILVRANVGQLFAIAEADPSKAAWCVKHDYWPAETVKMDGCVQSRYARKNWSSIMLLSLRHPANSRLTVEMVNSLPGRDLHALCWLFDEEIGDLDESWNWLCGKSDPRISPNICHFTEGTPSMPDCENVPFAAEWRAELERWAS